MTPSARPGPAWRTPADSTPKGGRDKTMHRGYVKFWRKSLDNDLIRNSGAWQLLSWCLLKATHRAHKQVVGSSIVDLKPGQLIFGRAAVSRELNSTERKIRTCLELLKKADFLTIETTNKFSIITVVNWTIYQDERPADDRQDDQQTTNKRPANDHKQECKECKECKEEEPPIPPTGGECGTPVDLPISSDGLPQIPRGLCEEIRQAYERALVPIGWQPFGGWYDKLVRQIRTCIGEKPSRAGPDFWESHFNRIRGSDFPNSPGFNSRSIVWATKPETVGKIENGMWQKSDAQQSDSKKERNIKALQEWTPPRRQS